MKWSNVATTLVCCGFVYLVGSVVAYYTNKKKCTVDDDISIRDMLARQNEGLQRERAGLVSEIQRLSDFCNKLEEQNRDLSMQIIHLQTRNDELEKKTAESNAEVASLRRTIDALSNKGIN